MLGITEAIPSAGSGMNIEGVDGRAPRGCFFWTILLCVLIAAGLVLMIYLALNSN